MDYSPWEVGDRDRACIAEQFEGHWYRSRFQPCFRSKQNRPRSRSEIPLADRWGSGHPDRADQS